MKVEIFVWKKAKILFHGKSFIWRAKMANYQNEQELRQAGHYTPVASNKMMHINWLLYNSVLRK